MSNVMRVPSIAPRERIRYGFKWAPSPNIYHPLAATAARHNRACFAGLRYADRDRWLAALVDAGVPVDIYGSGWGDRIAPLEPGTAARQERIYLGRKVPAPGSLESYCDLTLQEIRRLGPVRGLRRLFHQTRYRRETRAIEPRLQRHAKGWATDVTSLLASYDLSLNYSNVWADGRPGSDLIPHVRLRDFEATMCGACHLTGHTEEIAEVSLEVGREIETYRTPGGTRRQEPLLPLQSGRGREVASSRLSPRRERTYLAETLRTIVRAYRSVRIPAGTVGFSVVVPTYNRLALLQETLDSLWRQSYTNFEVIVVDDGSTDGAGIF